MSIVNQQFGAPRLIIHAHTPSQLAQLITLTVEESSALKESFTYPDWLHNLGISLQTHCIVAVAQASDGRGLVVHPFPLDHKSTIEGQVGYIHAKRVSGEVVSDGSLDAVFLKTAEDLISVVNDILRSASPVVSLEDRVGFSCENISHITSVSEALATWTLTGVEMIVQHKRYDFGLQQSAEVVAAAKAANSFEEWLASLGVSSATHYVYPLYLLDHSGLMLSKSPFGCKWDSGQIGYMYMRKDETIGLDVAGAASSRYEDFVEEGMTTKEANAARYAAWHMQQAIAACNAVWNGEVFEVDFSFTPENRDQEFTHNFWVLGVEGLDTSMHVEIENFAAEMATYPGVEAEAIKDVLVTKWKEHLHENHLPV